MSTWKDKIRKDWRYDFQYKLKRYAGGGLGSRREAIAALAARKKQVVAACSIDSDTNNEISDKYEALKMKYFNQLSNPFFTIPDLINEMMRDFDFAYNFKDIVAIVKSHNKAKAKVPAKIRMEVIERDGGICLICGRKPPDVVIHVDHIVPSSKGGLSEMRNLRTLCAECNMGKSNLFISVGATSGRDYGYMGAGNRSNSAINTLINQG